MLEVDKNVLCKIPFVKGIYVHTGVAGDGSCFYHAFLRATRGQYKYMSYDKRLEAVQGLRQKLADKVDDSTLSEIGAGEARHMLFFAELSARIAKGFPDDPAFAALNEAVNLQEVLEETTSFRGNFYFTFIEKVTTLGRERLAAFDHTYGTRISRWCYNMFLDANESLRAAFKSKLLSDQVDALQIGFIANQLNCNFLFLRESPAGELEPYPLNALAKDARKYVVFIWIDDCHYEPVGVLMEDKRVRRIFTESDDLVQKILNK
jgi:hypothetical protein